MLSVIVAIYNVEKYVEKAIKSIMHQSLKELEIILVDDGSTDNSGAICDLLAKQDERIVVIHKANGGLSDARNVGIDIAKGEYLAFVDGDDYIHPRMYEILMDNMDSTNSDLSLCSFTTICEDDIPDTALKNSEPFAMNKLEALNSLDQLRMTVAWNKIYKKALFNEIRYPKGRLHEDEFVIHHIFNACSKVVGTDEELYYYVVRNGSIMNTMNINRIDDIYSAFIDRFLFFDSINEKRLAENSGNCLINSMISYDKKAFENNDANKVLLRKKISNYLQEFINCEKYSCDDKYKFEARLFVFLPKACHMYRVYCDFSNKARNKLERTFVKNQEKKR